jgi:hypothetical protein
MMGLFLGNSFYMVKSKSLRKCHSLSSGISKQLETILFCEVKKDPHSENVVKLKKN